jgi:DeoR/GlpR family transcriptional regulator of sugar metabolism
MRQMQRQVRNPAARHHAIQRELATRGVVSVEELSRRLGASPATIRRDLAALEDGGRLQRTHGGAAVLMERPAETAFAVREAEAGEAKRAIAAAALPLLPPGGSVFMNDGSTVMALAREIVAAGIELFVATPAINVAAKLAESRSVTACLLGGVVGEASLATSGHFAESMVDQINADLALISPDGFSLRHGLTFSHARDAALARRMIARSARCVALVTAAKLNRVGRIVGTGTTEVAVVVTDCADAAITGAFLEHGIEVVAAADGAAR